MFSCCIARNAGYRNFMIRVDVRNAYKILVGNPEGQRPRRGLTSGKNGDIKFYLKFVRYENMNCI